MWPSDCWFLLLGLETFLLRNYKEKPPAEASQSRCSSPALAPWVVLCVVTTRLPPLAALLGLALPCRWGRGQHIQEGARPPACHWLLTAGGGLSVVQAVSQLRFVFTLSADVTWDSLLEQREVGIRFTLPAPPLEEETTGHRCKDSRPLSRAYAAHFRTPGFIPLAHLSVLVQIPPGFNSCNVIDFGLRKGNLPPCALCS